MEVDRALARLARTWPQGGRPSSGNGEGNGGHHLPWCGATLHHPLERDRLRVRRRAEEGCCLHQFAPSPTGDGLETSQEKRCNELSCS